MTSPWDETGGSPPTYEDVQRASTHARELAERAVAEEDDRVKHVAAVESRKVSRQVSRRSALVLLLVALLVPWLVSALAWQEAQSAAGIAATAAVNAATALERLDQANDVLEARGQPPVQPPPADDPDQVVAAAITAQVLASLPPAPTAQQVADLLRGAVVGQLQGPTVDELTRLTAEYFERIPAPPGPTEAQIRAAVQAELAINPPERGEACLPSNPECVGPQGRQGEAGEPGKDGTDGRSVVSGPAPVRTENGDCVWRTTYDRAPLVEQYPAGEFACPLMAPTTTAQPPPTTS